MVNQTELMGGPSWLLAAPSDLLRAPRYMRFAHRPCSGTRRRAQILSYGQQPRRGVAERCVCHPTWNGWHVEPERTTQCACHRQASERREPAATRREYQLPSIPGLAGRSWWQFDQDLIACGFRILNRHTARDDDVRDDGDRRGR